MKWTRKTLYVAITDSPVQAKKKEKSGKSIFTLKENIVEDETDSKLHSFYWNTWKKV